jgi:hypothetical protein
MKIHMDDYIIVMRRNKNQVIKTHPSANINIDHKFVVKESQLRCKKIRKTMRVPRLNRKPMQEDERRRKFTASRNEKQEDERSRKFTASSNEKQETLKESNQSGAEN